MNWYSFLIGVGTGATTAFVVATIVVRFYVLSFLTKFINALGGPKKNENP